MARTVRPRKPAIDRFNSFALVVPSGCIEWTGYIDRHGYGRFGPGGRDGGKVSAHRWSYEHNVGPIPDGFQIDHLCRNRKCVNPDHLEPVTQRENILRGVGASAANARKSTCPAGHAYTDDNVYISPTDGSRNCRECMRERERNRPRRGRRAA
jgi:hypothetical protein